MANTISAGIALGGEKEYRSAIAAIKDDMKLLASEAKLTTEQYKENDSSLEALTKQTEVYDKQAETQREKIELLEKALKNAQDQYGENSKQAKSWQTQLNDANTELLKTEKAIEKNNDKMKDMSSFVGKAKSAIEGWKEKVAELKENHEHLFNGLHKVGDAAEGIAKGGLKLLGGAAAGAVAGVAAIGAAAVKAGKELGQLMMQAADAGDAIDKQSQKIGVSAEQYQILSYQAELSGTSISTIEKAASKLKSAGSDMDVSEAIEKLASIQDPAERSAAAVEMFGAKTAQELTPLLNQGTEGLEEMAQAARDNGLVMSNEAVSASAQFQDSLTTLKDTASAMKNNLISELLPGAKKALDGLTGVLTGKEGAAEQLKEGVNDMIASFKDMLPRALEIVKTLCEALISVAPDIVISLADGIIDNLEPLLNSALVIISELTEGLLTPENIQNIIKAALELVKGLAKFLIDNVDLVINSAFLIVNSLFKGLTSGKSMKELVDAALMLVEKICTGLIDNLPALLEAAFELAKSLAEALLDYDWWSLAKKIFTSIKDAFKGLFKREDEGEDIDENSQPNGSFAQGLSYVPYDGYTAELHRGERVLTAYEAATYSSGSAETVNEIRELRTELAAMRAEMRRYGLPVDVRNTKQIGQQVGRAVRV